MAPLYDPFDESIWDDPFPTFRRLRDEAPACYLPEYDCWFVSRFEDVWRLEQDQRPLTSKFGTTTTHLLTRQTPTSPNLSSLDGAEHTRVRAWFNPHFKPARMRTLEPRVAELAKQAVDRALEQGGGDAVELGGHVSVRVVCELLGLPVEDADQILAWVNGFFEREPGRRGSTEAGIDAAKQLGMYLFRLAKTGRERGAPEGSVLQRLLAEPLAGEPLDDMGVAVHLNMLVIGGTETFPKVFSAALHRLWEHPDQRRACAADPDLVPDAFHETLRYDMPTQMLGRTVAREIELHGHTLRPGSGVMFLWGSANRDEREFDDPDRFDVTRRARRILSFGHGQHMCLGAHVARLEGRVLLGEVLRRMPGYDLDLAGSERLRSEFVRGWAKLPVRV
ncbi:MAG: cytochrome P450 [Myxococcota bacterium]